MNYRIYLNKDSISVSPEPNEHDKEGHTCTECFHFKNVETKFQHRFHAFKFYHDNLESYNKPKAIEYSLAAKIISKALIKKTNWQRIRSLFRWLLRF